MIYVICWVYFNSLFAHGNMNPGCITEGVDISPFLWSPNNPLQFWLPDLQIFQAIETTILGQSVKLRDQGVLYWSQHIIVTLSEPQVDFLMFPLDQHSFMITVQSYSFDSNIMTLGLVSAAKFS